MYVAAYVIPPAFLPSPTFSLVSNRVVLFIYGIKIYAQ
jgi:hypothetical protein